ncbi:MAG: M23 family metallopeptidase [Elusimicrobia bacterium]|nr:M23 family metallopeptidase [Elusimicrobiota bacterium]
MLWRSVGRFFKNVAKPVSVFIIPHNGMPSVRFNLPVFFLLAGGIAWTGITIWAGYIAGRHFDYYVTKADNKVLRTKMSYVSEQVEKGLAYLEMTKRTDSQLRKVLGMDPSDFVKEDGYGGPQDSDLADFRRMLNAKASEIKETSLNNSIQKMQDESRKRLSSYTEMTLYLADRHNSVRATPSIWPTEGRITSPFGYRIHPLRMSTEYHSGVDIANEAGTPVHATADGVVRHAGWAQGYGMCVVVDHGFGYSTLYGHMSEIVSKEGQQVKRGQLVGRMGSTGTSTGNHLHYEVWTSGIPRDPMKYLKVGGSGNTSTFAGLFDGIFGGL